MTVYAILLSAPEGSYDLDPEGSKIAYVEGERTMIFMAIDEREHIDITSPVQRDVVVSKLWREYTKATSAAPDKKPLVRLKGATVQVVPMNKLAAMITRQGEYADA